MRHVPLPELQANTAELTAAMDAGEEIVITLGGRDYKLVATRPDLSPERRQAMEETAAFRERLRNRGARVTHEDIRAWANEGRP